MYNEKLTQEQNDRLNHSFTLTADQELDEIEAKPEEDNTEYELDINEAQAILAVMNMKDLEEEANYSEVEENSPELKPFLPYVLPLIPIM